MQYFGEKMHKTKVFLHKRLELALFYIPFDEYLLFFAKKNIHESKNWLT